ncbi:MAG TPA: amino acid permease [Gammaproteobacteria bacterium]|nr:amino acid permease [Gammaproteobacteria bacterium]
MTNLAQLSRRKSVEQLQQEAGESRHFRRVLGLWQLTAIGLGGIIGVGIFVLTGVVAATQAGPAVTLSFILAGIASGAAALCYAEFAGMIPVSGSAYTYGYAVLGEFAAWLLGWDLLLCYALIVAVVAAGWSGYVQALLGAAGVHLPAWAQGAAGSGPGHEFDVIAALVALAIAGLLTVRTEWGARFNTAIVAVKIAGVLLVILAGVFYIKPANWSPFMPFGFSGVLAGAAVVFFAVFGYDTLTTAAEEAKDPQRDLPWAVVLSLGIAMVLYLALSLVLTGIVPSSTLNNAAPVANAFTAIGLSWVMVAVSAAAVTGITSVLFANMLAGARIGFALSRDGLLPAWFSGVHPRFRTPHRATLILGAVTALSAGFFPLATVARLVNVGMLGAFVVICGAILVLRRARPELKRSFRVPFVPLVPLLGMGFSAWLIYGLPTETYVSFTGWMLLGVAIYFAYGLKHSGLARG